ncbi:hypothetical protein SAMN05661080_02744 [Modestobacter sp. DSM 44400]|uniref:hypothetical protein n=1 Tax=Modestobacter sp. DSM 44400 TaxID=1550230 RepID=UPI0008983F12|nr:hypothetical protein [Modestobacter sp. DSM 44400]SDY22461.1 hypothetical protein SAMN05661080_02744 [Modestobacter sp. DSM 44400]
MSRLLVPRIPRGRRPTALAQWGLAGLAAVLLATTFVWHSAYADFSDATSAVTVPVSTATVVLGDDDAGTAMFRVSALKPGAMGTRCIAVTATGSTPALVKLYRTSGTTSRSLASYLLMTVSAGSGGGSGGSGGCGAFVPSADLYSGTVVDMPNSYSGGVDSWQTAGTTTGEVRSYRITFSLSSSAPVSAAGGSVSVGFTWEAQST